MKKNNLIKKMILGGAMIATLAGCGGSGGSSSNGQDDKIYRNLYFKQLPEETLYITDNFTGERKIRDVNGEVTFSSELTDLNGNLLPFYDVETSAEFCDKENNCYNIIDNSPKQENIIDLSDLGDKRVNLDAVDLISGSNDHLSFEVHKNSSPYLVDNDLEQRVIDFYTNQPLEFNLSKYFKDDENDNIKAILSSNYVTKIEDIDNKSYVNIENKENYEDNMSIEILDNTTIKFLNPGFYELKITPKDQFGKQGDNLSVYFNVTPNPEESCLTKDGLEVKLNDSIKTYSKNIVESWDSCERYKIESRCIYDRNTNTLDFDKEPLNYNTCKEKTYYDGTGDTDTTIGTGTGNTDTGTSIGSGDEGSI